MKKQLTKWFYYKSVLKIVSLFFVMSCLQIVAAQKNEDVIVIVVEQGETLYKYSVLYDVQVDSLKKWNNLKSDEIKKGNQILIINYNEVDSHQLEINKLKYDNEVVTQALILNKKIYNKKLDLLNDRKAHIDGESPYGMQALFEISKEKSNLKDEFERKKEELENRQVSNNNLILEKEKEYSYLKKKKKTELHSETEVVKETQDLNNNENIITPTEENVTITSTTEVGKEKKQIVSPQSIEKDKEKNKLFCKKKTSKNK